MDAHSASACAIARSFSSKKGVYIHQLHRMLDVTYTTAWFLAHRLREAVRSDELASLWPG